MKHLTLAKSEAMNCLTLLRIASLLLLPSFDPQGVDFLPQAGDRLLV
jgi:hypothetical protein